MSSSLLVPHTQHSPKQLGESFLKLQLQPGVYAHLLMKQVQEVLVLPSTRLTPMPNMPSEVLGLISRRGRILWVIDLIQLLGIGYLDSAVQQHNLAIVQVDKISLALAVHQIDGMGWLLPEDIHSPAPHVSSALMPYLRGSAYHEEQVSLVLNISNIVHSSLFQQYSPLQETEVSL